MSLDDEERIIGLFEREEDAAHAHNQFMVRLVPFSIHAVPQHPSYRCILSLSDIQEICRGIGQRNYPHGYSTNHSSNQPISEETGKRKRSTPRTETQTFPPYPC